MFIRKYFPFLFVGSALQVFSPVGVCNEPPNSYRAEAELGYSTTDGDDYDSKIVDLGFAYYLSPVSISNTPYAEAPFLERAGAITVAYGKVDFESDFADGDGPAYGFDFRYAEKNMPFYIEVIYFKTDQDFDGKEIYKSANIKADTRGVGLGYFLSDDSAISLHYSQGDTTSEFYDPVPDLIFVAPERQTNKSNTDNYSLEFKKVILLEQNRAFNLDIGLLRSSYDDEYNDSDRNHSAESGDNDEISLAVDYYSNAATSFGVGFSTNSGDEESVEGDTLSLRAKYYVTPKFFFEGVFADFSAKQDDNDSQTISFAVGARF